MNNLFLSSEKNKLQRQKNHQKRKGKFQQVPAVRILPAVLVVLQIQVIVIPVVLVVAVIAVVAVVVQAMLQARRRNDTLIFIFLLYDV